MTGALSISSAELPRVHLRRPRNSSRQRLGVGGRQAPRLRAVLTCADSRQTKTRKSQVDLSFGSIYSTLLFDGLWLSLARAPRSGRGGRGFESHQPDYNAESAWEFVGVQVGLGLPNRDLGSFLYWITVDATADRGKRDLLAPSLYLPPRTKLALTWA